MSSKNKGKIGQTGEVEDDLLVPYKKVKFLPAYFFKVFIKKKKEQIDPKKAKKQELGKSGKDFKKDPKKGSEVEQGDIQDVINIKTKKLKQKMEQEEEDYKLKAKLSF